MDFAIVLKFLKKDLSPESKQWLIKKLTDVTATDIGGLKCDLMNGVDDSVYHVWADARKLQSGADILGAKRGCRVADLSKPADLSIVDQHSIILDEIESIRFLWSDQQCSDLPPFDKDEAIFSKCKNEGTLTYFPVHNPEALEKLEEHWVKDIFSDQPIDEIQSYFGDGVGMYFAFLGFYTKWLFLPAFIGVLFHLLSLFLTFNVAGYFSLFNVVWCSVFFVLWRRKSTSLAYKWGSLNFSKFDKPRPEFRGDRTEEDPITHKMEPTCSYKSKYYKLFFGSLPIILIFLAISLFLGLAYFWIEDYIRWINHSDDPHNYRSYPLTWPLWIASLVVISVYCVLIYALDILYRKVAYALNNWENHRLQSSYDNFLIAKLVVFNFINYFHCLFYVAFYMRDLDMLKKNLATLLITWQIIQQVQEAVLPYLKYKAKKAKTVHKDEDAIKKTLNYQIKKDLAKDEYQTTLDDFLEMFFQFGYVFLFSAVFPAAAFWALVNNLTEVRTDAFKLCYIFRKPIPRQCDGIGTWLVAFELLGVMAVITNCSVISMNPDIKDFFAHNWNFSEMDVFFIFIVVEHVLLFVKGAILFLVPSTPNWIKVQVAERDYRAQEALVEEVKSTSSRVERVSSKKDI